MGLDSITKRKGIPRRSWGLKVTAGVMAQKTCCCLQPNVSSCLALMVTSGNGASGPRKSQLGELGPGSKTAELEGLPDITKPHRALGGGHGGECQGQPSRLCNFPRARLATTDRISQTDTDKPKSDCR